MAKLRVKTKKPKAAAKATAPEHAVATLHFRIAAIDPSQPGHVTAWSAWVAGTAH